MIAAVSTLSLVTLAVAIFATCVSVYGALLARAGQRWQRQVDAERRTTKVEVDLEHASTPDPLIMFGWDAKARTFSYEIGVRITNKGEAPEFVRNVWLQSGDRGIHILDAKEPERVDPRGFRVFTTTVDFSHIPLEDEFTVEVQLGSQSIVTPPQRWMTDLLEDVGASG